MSFTDIMVLVVLPYAILVLVVLLVEQRRGS